MCNIVCNKIHEESEPVPEFYEVILERNNNGRICNYHSRGSGEKVKVPAAEWERFNLLAGRQHKLIGDVVVFDETLTPGEPD